MRILVSPSIRVIAVGMRSSRRMALFGCGIGHKGVNHFRMRFWIGPILRDYGPLRAQALLIGVGVLNYESLHPLRMRQDHAEAHRPAIVMEIEGAFIDLELIEEIVGGLRQVVKGVRIRRWQRRVTLSESRKVRRYH